MTFQHPTGRLYYHTVKIISVTIPTHFSCHSLCLWVPSYNMARSNILLSKLVIIFLDNKSSYKMVRISSHPLGSFPSPSNISHRKITQTKHIKKFMKKLSRCLPVLAKVRNGFSRICNLANLAVPGLTGRQLLLSTGGEQNMQIYSQHVNPY